MRRGISLATFWGLLGLAAWVTVRGVVVHVHDQKARVEAERCVREHQRAATVRLGYQVGWERGWDEDCGALGLEGPRPHRIPDRLDVRDAWSPTSFATMGPGHGPPLSWVFGRIAVA